MCYYRTDDGKCRKFTDDKYTSYCVDGPCPDDTPTNADKIRGMSDEELARFLARVENRRSAAGNGAMWNGMANALDWLKQPVKEEHYETD